MPKQLFAQDKTKYKDIIAVEIREQKAKIENNPIYEIPIGETPANKTNKRYKFIVSSIGLDEHLSYTGFLYAYQLDENRTKINLLILINNSANNQCLNKSFVVSRSQNLLVDLEKELELTASYKLIEKYKYPKLKNISSFDKTIIKNRCNSWCAAR